MLNANFTAVPNNTLEDLYKSGLSGTELRIMLFIIRQTAGFHRERVQLSAAQIASECRMSTASVDRAIAVLKRAGFISVSVDRSSSVRSVRFEGASSVSPDSNPPSELTDVPFKRKTKEKQKEKQAPPSEKAEMEKLISDYGEERVREYTEKVRKWAKKRGISLTETVRTVRKWLEADGIRRLDFDVSKYEFVINNF